MDRIVKVDGTVYTETELRGMTEAQLKALITKCQCGIEEIERKSVDYRINNYDEGNIEHYNQVLEKFKAASIYLQADIVLINNIIKEIQPTLIEKELTWYKEYYNTVNSCIMRGKQKKVTEFVINKLGYAI